VIFEVARVLAGRKKTPGLVVPRRIRPVNALEGQNAVLLVGAVAVAAGEEEDVCCWERN
jgi:hypothetical protein